MKSIMKKIVLLVCLSHIFICHDLCFIYLLNNYGREPETESEIFVAELKVLGPDFVYGVISMIDGERDPRNLLQLFGMLPHFIKTFPLGHLTEEMFDVVSCYFPVDFYSVSI